MVRKRKLTFVSRYNKQSKKERKRLIEVFFILIAIIAVFVLESIDRLRTLCRR